MCHVISIQIHINMVYLVELSRLSLTRIFTFVLFFFFVFEHTFIAHKIYICDLTLYASYSYLRRFMVKRHCFLIFQHLRQYMNTYVHGKIPIIIIIEYNFLRFDVMFSYSYVSTKNSVTNVSSRHNDILLNLFTYLT